MPLKEHYHYTNWYNNKNILEDPLANSTGQRFVMLGQNIWTFEFFVSSRLEEKKIISIQGQHALKVKTKFKLKRNEKWHTRNNLSSSPIIDL